MLICEGNTSEYELLEKASCDVYLLKLENFVDKLEARQKQVEAMRNKNH